MAEILFKRGALAQLPTTAVDGTFYVTTDEGAIYLGVGTEMKRLGDYVSVASIADLPTDHTKISKHALYYAEAENVLARSNGSKWVQINAAGLVSLNAATGDGNVITSISVDGEGKVTPHKGLTVASQSELNTLKNLVGTESVDSRISAAKQELNQAIAAVDKLADQGIADAAAAQKTADEAKSAASTNATNIGNNTSAINGLKTQVGTGTVDERIAAAKKDLQDKIDAVDTLADQGIADAATAQSKANDAFTKASTNETNIGTLQTDVAGLKTADTKLAERVQELETSVGTGGSVDEKIAALRKEILTDGTANDTINDAYDTIKEISDWLGSNELGKTAGEIISDLNTHANDINGLKAQVGTGTVDSRIEAAKTEMQGKIDAVDALADQGIADAAAAQKTADNAAAQANTNKTDIATNLASINGLKTQVGEGTVDSRIATAKQELTEAINAVDELADQGIADAATAQAKANEAFTKATSNATTIATHTTDINTNKTNIANLQAALTWGSFN